MEAVIANKDRFKKKAKVTATVLKMTKLMSPKKKKPSKAKGVHNKERRKSKIIVVDYDSKKVTDITNLVSDIPASELQYEDTD